MGGVLDRCLRAMHGEQAWRRLSRRERKKGRDRKRQHRVDGARFSLTRSLFLRGGGLKKGRGGRVFRGIITAGCAFYEMGKDLSSMFLIG